MDDESLEMNLPARPVGRPSSYDPKFCDEIEQFMRAGFSMTAFAGHIGVARATLNNWMAEHPEFLEAVSRGKSARLLHWEEAAIRVAKRGGGPGTATIIMFGLKNMAPEEYSDTQKHEHTGKDGGPIKTEEVSARDIIAGKLDGLAAADKAERDT